MSWRAWTVFFVVSSIVLASGCGQSDSVLKNSPNPAAPVATKSNYLLSTKPTDAQGVIDARKTVKDNDEITVIGRIGGDTNPWVEGRASFLIVDTSIKPCNEKGDDACPTPWDYCCDLDLLPDAKAIVKFVDENGRTLQTDARQLLGLKELQTVVVQGKAKRDEAGNLTVLGSGVFVQP